MGLPDNSCTSLSANNTKVEPSQVLAVPRLAEHCQFRKTLRDHIAKGLEPASSARYKVPHLVPVIQ